MGPQPRSPGSKKIFGNGVRGRVALASIELVDVHVGIDESASMNLCQAGVLERVVRG